MDYERAIVDVIAERIQEPWRFIQVLVGPRQIGKTTAVRQAIERACIEHLVVEATRGKSDASWLRAQWYRARRLKPDHGPLLLVLDEVQPVPAWAGVVRTLWDEDTASGTDIRVLIVASSETLVREGIDASLAGRCETIDCGRWTLAECRRAFGYTLDDYLLYGGYPGAAPLRNDRRRWLRYTKASVIEPSIANDALPLADVRKPELLRALFAVGAPLSGREISYRKLLAQAQARGSTETAAQYLSLLDSASLLSGIPKFDPEGRRQRSSSPKLLVHDIALMTATSGRRFNQLLTNPDLRGRLIESAVGAHLLELGAKRDFELSWWREGRNEVDFVITHDGEVTAIEVESGRPKPTGGMTEFLRRYPRARTLVIGTPGCPLEDFLLSSVHALLAEGDPVDPMDKAIE